MNAVKISDRLLQALLIRKRVLAVFDGFSEILQDETDGMIRPEKGTVYTQALNWRAAGAAKPESRYGRLLVEFEKADTLARAKMVKKLLDDPDWRATWKIMCNRWPEIYRDSYALKQEISGPAGGPVQVSSTPFVVEIRCDESLEKLDFGPIIDRTNGNGAGYGAG